MTPYYQDDWVTIYHGDCREILPALPKVDLVLTDPPYGIGRLMKGGRNTGHWNQLSEGNPWDMETPDLSEILNKSEHLVIWGGNYFALPPSRCWLAWVKLNAVPTQSYMELAWTNIDAPARCFEWASGGAYKREHPTQKPLELMTWCINHIDGYIKKFAEPFILDPFMGSGTTLRAAKDLNRKAIGIEIEEKYCEIAAKRMQQEVFNFKN